VQGQPVDIRDGAVPNGRFVKEPSNRQIIVKKPCEIRSGTVLKAFKRRIFDKFLAIQRAPRILTNDSIVKSAYRVYP